VSTRSDYSLLERWTHRIAFLHRSIQLTAADVEAAVFRKKYEKMTAHRPVFITSLPRAGTTLLLEVLAGSPELASHCYRDMPFVMAPILWGSLSRPFRVASEPRERAHGDGVKVGFDSPEAFEEVIWRAFWPKWFRGETLPLWPSDAESPGFAEFLRSHMKKIIAVRGGVPSRPRRYLSKNNANVARMGLLRRLFPDSTIVVPFRSPLDQAESLRRQHLRFLELHGQDRFARHYMQDLGHLEFGELHKPFNFPGISTVRSRFSPLELDYWIGYWRVAFGAILEEARGLVLVSYEKLCQRGSEGLAVIGERLGMQDPLGRGGSGPVLREPRRYELDTGDLEAENVEESWQIHARLLDLSVV